MTFIAVIGHGTVGSGVVDVLHYNQEGITKRAKELIKVKYICDLHEFPDLPYSNKFIKDVNIILNDPEIRIVVECIGGLKPAYGYVRACLERGKSVVTSNKELVAEKGQELLELAQEKNLNFLFEASVGGCIPIIRPLSQCMAANEVLEIAGILNGTSNFILTKMSEENTAFSDALLMAQKLGYAERDPAADVDGDDACRKISILASLAFGRHVFPSQVSTQGIRDITPDDLLYAKAYGAAIKLIALCRRRDDGRLDMCVAPMFVPGKVQLASVNGVYNAVLAWGNMTGDVMFSGRGAGKLPTASAVVADVIDSVKHFKARKYLYWDKGDKDMICPAEKQLTRMYLRVRGLAPERLKNAVQAFFGVCEAIYIEGRDDEAAFITPENTLEKHKDTLKMLKDFGVEPLSFLRVFPEINF